MIISIGHENEKEKMVYKSLSFQFSPGEILYFFISTFYIFSTFPIIYIS